MTKDIITFVFLIGFSFLCAQNRSIPVDTLVKPHIIQQSKDKIFHTLPKQELNPFGTKMVILWQPYFIPIILEII